MGAENCQIGDSEVANEALWIGVDVGTGSARAGIFDSKGTFISHGTQDITLHREADGFVEQSSENIWEAVCVAVKEALKNGAVDASRIKGIGIDATCSLVVLDEQCQPLTVRPVDDPARNVIVWMDHRAREQATRINATRHRVLDYVGKKISPEMQTPKLLWLKENMAQTFNAAGHFFDLTDYLTWRASGDFARSICTVTCKWTYMAHEQSWDASYFDQIGLAELKERNFARIGNKIVDAGIPLGNGLTNTAARNLGLLPGTPVGAGLIDAHAGGIGTVGATGAEPSSRMAYVFGTSACTLSTSVHKALVPGVWGPYYSAMVPGLWLSEGGQSAAGEAVGHVLKMHPAHERVKREAEAAGYILPNYLLQIMERRKWNASEALLRAKQLLIVPDFLGNRAPFADPKVRGILAGLDLDTSVESLLGIYIACITGIGYGLRQILDVQRENGVSPDTVVISGGAGESSFVKQLLADSARIPVAGTTTKEPVLLGSAILAAVAGGRYATLMEAMRAMSSEGELFHPATGDTAVIHERRFRAFVALQKAGRILSESDD